MINWDEELKRIFDDPLLADVTAPKKKTTSSDRLIAGFQRIVEFVEVNGRRPRNDADREERSLYNQLKGILSDSAKKERCRPYDSVGLLDDGNDQVVSEPPSAYGLAMQTPEQQLEAIFADPLFDNVGQVSDSLFDLPDYMKRKLEESTEERMAVHVASMKMAWSRASICRHFARTCIVRAIRYKTCRL